MALGGTFCGSCSLLRNPFKDCYLCTNQVCGCVEDIRRSWVNEGLGYVVFNIPTTSL